VPKNVAEEMYSLSPTMQFFSLEKSVKIRIEIQVIENQREAFKAS
jgi:hypothetical protein